jgi:hypothetical protein
MIGSWEGEYRAPWMPIIGRGFGAIKLLAAARFGFPVPQLGPCSFERAN